jgi:hypothetical protein
MEYPIIIGGERRGRLCLSCEGLYTVIEAQLPGIHEGLHRLWLHGGGERVYLGLMQPWSGGMYLRSKLSRQQMAAFPKHPEYASDGDNISLHNHNEAPADPDQPGENPQMPLPASSAHEPPAAKAPKPAISAPAPPIESATTKAHVQWFRRPDGTRFYFEGGSLRHP